jgi:uncharacterized protein
MPVVTEHAPGTPSWVDIGTSDVDGAIAFYSGLFGWEIEKGEPEMGHYSMATIDGKAVCAIADQQIPGMVVWTTYITVAHVDDTVAKIEKAGGSIVAPAMDVMEFGRMAVASDTAGAIFSLWQPNQNIGAEIVNEPGTLVWNELTTRAVDESIAFYGDVFGWTTQRDEMPGGQGEYITWLLDGKPVGGMMPMVGDMWPPELPNHWMVYFAVEDCDASAATCTELGGQVSVPPTDIPPGRFAVLNDPQGGTFSIMQLNAPI